MIKFKENRKIDKNFKIEKRLNNGKNFESINPKSVLQESIYTHFFPIRKKCHRSVLAFLIIFPSKFLNTKNFSTHVS